MDVEIRDEDMRAVPTCESGEIWMKSPTLIRGYWESLKRPPRRSSRLAAHR